MPCRCDFSINFRFLVNIGPLLSTVQAMNASCVSLLICMKLALARSVFFGRGGTLELACQHMYPHVRNKAFVPTDDQPQLKGADACIVAMAHSLGLTVRMRMLPDVGPRRNVTSNCEREAVQVHIKDGEHRGMRS